ncbi:MAG: transporter substrate-binding domain-containing protein [Desulfobacter sp.]|nr:MAG: transporter substrate-binding domain-containing protein [Desulfobacter sp.]
MRTLIYNRTEYTNISCRIITAVLTAILLILAAMPGFCNTNPPSHNTKDTRRPPLKIAASIDNTPFHFADDRGRAVGMFVDLWRLWSKKTGREVEFIPLPWAQSLEMVKTGRADIHAGCFYSAQRDEYLDYAAELRDCQTHFFFHDSIYGLKTLKDLKGFEIGLLDKDYAFEFVSRELPGAAIKIYNSHQALFKGVEKGDIKVFVCDTPTALYFLTRNQLISKFRYHPSSPLYRKPFFAAVREGNAPLVSLINQGLSAITREERASIERKWMGRAPVQPKDRLIIGVDRSFPPFSMRSAQGAPSGFLVDYWQAWAEKSDRHAVIRLYERQEGVNALKDGIIDILSTFPSGKNMGNWSDTCAPIYRLDWYFYQPRPKTGPALLDLNPKEPFKGIVLGIPKASQVGEWARQSPMAAGIVPIDTTKQMILASGQGQIDGFLATAQEMAVLPGQMGIAGDFARSRIPVFRLQLRPGVRDYAPGLIQDVDKGFKRLSHWEKAEIEAKWIPDPNLRIYSPGSPDIHLTDAEEEWLTARKLSGIPIRLGIHPGLPPIEFMGKGSTHQGMVSDVINLLKERLGLSFELVSATGAETVDAVPAALSFDAEHPDMVYTRPYMSFPRVIITRTQSPLLTGLMDMTGKTLVCIGTDPAVEQLNTQWPGIRIRPVESVKDGLNMVLQGRADGYLGNLALAAYQIQANNYTQLKVAAAAAISDSDLAIAVNKELPELLSILNKGIATITRPELDQIRQKWFTVRVDQGSDLAFVRIMARRVAFAVLLVFCLVLFWNRMIRRREERFKCLTEHGTDIIQAFEPDGRLVYASPSHATVLGYPMKQIKNSSVFSLIHPEDVPGFRQMLKNLMNTGSTATQVYRIRHYKGHDIFFESHCMDLLENKAIKAFVVNGRDITDALKTRDEIEKARESAEAANRNKSDFLAGLSHEIRTPLNAILGMTEMTLNSSLKPAQSQNLNAVLSAARHLKAVISDILDFSTIEAGKMKVFQKNFRIDTLLDNIAHIWRAEAHAKGLEFHLETDKTIPAGVRSDPVRLNQILTNLLSNAVKFTPKGGITLSVGIASTPSQETDFGNSGRLVPKPLPFDADPKSGEKRLIYVSFKVKDTGIGIDKAHLKKIFKRFTQAQGDITREYGGTGLGLSLCREMAVMLGGNIEVKSRPGKGSTFTLTLPLVVLPYPVKVMATETVKPVAGVDALTLLLAEDDPVNRSVFKEMVTPLGCTVLETGDGEQAVARLKEKGADLIFMDLEMPGTDGLTAARLIREGRAGEAYQEIPIIAMTAHVLDEYRSRAKASGMDEFIPKPVEYNELIAILNTYAKLKAQKSSVPVDSDKALSALGGNVMLMDKIKEIFIAQTPELMAALESAKSSGDPGKIALAAHTLKGAGKRVYAQKAAEAAARLESLARDADTLSGREDISLAIHETLAAFDQLIEWLKNNQHKEQENR